MNLISDSESSDSDIDMQKMIEESLLGGKYVLQYVYVHAYIYTCRLRILSFKGFFRYTNNARKTLGPPV